LFIFAVSLSVMHHFKDKDNKTFYFSPHVFYFPPLPLHDILLGLIH